VNSGEICGGWRGTGGGFSLTFFGFPMLIIIPSLFYTHLLPTSKASDSSTQTSHYHILSLQDESFIHHSTGPRVRKLILLKSVVKWWTSPRSYQMACLIRARWSETKRFTDALCSKWEQQE
jgi:hypothetical protein